MKKNINYILILIVILTSANKSFADLKIDWETIQTPSTTLTMKKAFIDNNTFVIGGMNGFLAKTLDDGKNFTTLKSPQVDDIFGLYFSSGKIGYLGGLSGQIYYTDNGGTDWKKLESGLKAKGTQSDSYILEIGKIGNKIYATGLDGESLSGVFLTSSDGGTNWSKVVIPNSIATSNCYFKDDKIGFMTTFSFSGGTLFKTENGGQSWEIALTSTTQMFSVASSNDYVYATDAEGKVYISKNNGANWDTEQIENAAELSSIALLNDSTIVTCGENGALFVSTNYGHKWDKPSFVKPDDLFKDVQFHNGAIYVNGDLGKIYKGKLTITDIQNDENLNLEKLDVITTKSDVKFSLSSNNTSTLQLYEVNGKEIQNVNYQANRISNLQKGAYVYKLKSASGKEFFGKFIIE